jgi:hypothetical protein
VEVPPRATSLADPTLADSEVYLVCDCYKAMLSPQNKGVKLHFSDARSEALHTGPWRLPSRAVDRRVFAGLLWSLSPVARSSSQLDRGKAKAVFGQLSPNRHVGDHSRESASIRQPHWHRHLT